MFKKFKFRNEDLTYLYKTYKIKKVSKCIICNNSKTSKWTNSELFPAKKCKNCELVFMSKQLEDVGLNDYYSNYIGKRRTNNKLKMQQRKKQYVIDINLIYNFVKKGKVLDVGCNGGFLLNEFSDKFVKYGTEVDLKSVEYANKYFPKFANNIFYTSLLSSNFKSNYFDLVTMRGVIEHVSDPISHIKKISKILKKNGYLYICATPNGESKIFSIYKERWNLFHPVQHLWHFSPKNLNIICKKYGLRLVYKDFFYLNTPYENFTNDLKDIVKEIKKPSSKISPPFYENMMSLIFQKN